MSSVKPSRDVDGLYLIKEVLNFQGLNFYYVVSIAYGLILSPSFLFVLPLTSLEFMG